ncbi:hypothetical protein GCM10010210_21740 [Pseudonocardia hydrocarbonoxydans]|uniref:Uncharacterized protein n=1 Tax=Pseudonocardia hydrocarbonoxydans TaxID=76726 RepID=A0A4Y3WRL4_9PSEU|nr:hypothetical protein PHY01_38100 [Pseudonocardia hydrocarbonoxydans]
MAPRVPSVTTSGSTQRRSSDRHTAADVYVVPRSIPSWYPMAVPSCPRWRAFSSPSERSAHALAPILDHDPIGDASPNPLTPPGAIPHPSPGADCVRSPMARDPPIPNVLLNAGPAGTPALPHTLESS